jgi:hypothetical protein
MIYITNFFVALGLFHASGKNQKHLRIFLIVLAVFILCLLAGLRSTSIGIDVDFYVTNNIPLAKKVSLNEFLQLNSSTTEVGFYFFLYISAAHSTGTFLPLFTIHLLIIVPLAISCYLLKKDIDIPAFWCLFLFSLYNTTLCLMRQSIASSFLLLGMTLIYQAKRQPNQGNKITQFRRKKTYNKKEFIWGIFFLLISTLFHTSALIYIVLIFLSFLLKKHKRAAYFIVAITFLILLNLNSIVVFSHQIGILRDRYYYTYITRENNNKGIGVESTAFNLLISLFPLLIAKKKHCAIKEFRFILLMSIPFIFSGLINEYMTRLSLTFNFLNLIPFAITYKKESEKEKALSFLALISVCLTHWLWNNVHSDPWETNPYILQK